ncbi:MULTISPECIES: hypothetical protein [Salinivibrio]|jgi:hypothetical protein|uniref:Dethiobiotin synthetase n=2 Tax=Salinivibrio TaxID=51366 RepID=A0ABY7LC19_9GAMM|nr:MULTISPECIES: hypothetical protein [Salinivibrio]QIR06293.1 hypothetical protein HBA18_07830 [Salinivibrio costicola]WBA13696.1 hypothetical protein N7E60_07995 [Salinivibrio proteolyticus]
MAEKENYRVAIDILCCHLGMSFDEACSELGLASDDASAARQIAEVQQGLMGLLDDQK